MMSSTGQLITNAEREAAKAEALPAFGSLNLLHIRRQVALLLNLIGREGIFDEYTVHDISHIDKMLNSLDWIIPDTTKQVMTPADWLMTVLGVYFHDMGMLVTRREYERRNSTDYPRYRDETLFGGSNGEDYRQKVAELGEDRAERFLYQEFVRHKHAERVRAWVTGRQRPDLGQANEAAEQIEALLNHLGPQFRRDLGLVCESHHLNDLNDLTKYKTSQPYGDSDPETANLQYCAVLLRTSDLLHITSDRTPSITFKTINPTDPLSQQEWAKQLAVKRVRPKPGLNEEGMPDESIPKDTVEVYAYFTNEAGFFGLTSYLVYAANELRQSHEWVANAKKQSAAKHEFPWRRIDDSHIEAEGFERESFEFTIDQAKILDLLTGHTLYNDTRVVIRELVQNAIDAIRLEFYPRSPGPEGRVLVKWNSRARTLTVTDNGTGMTQEIISNFLLRVGTSRYQDPEFKKQFPGFSSISRFGIGVLSTFMIADSVEVTTCHPGDESARRITLRSVHGKYLIRLFSKGDATVARLVPHGTEFTLKVRPSVRMHGVLETARRWVVVPNCSVVVEIDDEKPVQIGYLSPADALLSTLREMGIAAERGFDTRPPNQTSGRVPVRVLEQTDDGVSVAYAVEWSGYFQEWSFLEASRIGRAESELPILGTCVEGMRVEFGAPGYEGPRIFALANVTGPSAPKTNVARSGLEATEQRDNLLRTVYRVYGRHIEAEIRELYTSRSFSLTWAVEEGRYLSRTLVGTPAERGMLPISERLLREAISEIKFFPVERAGNREAIAPRTLAAERGFWTIDAGLLRSAEPLIREAATSASLSRLLRTLDIPNFDFPADLVLCGIQPDDSFAVLAFSRREVERIIIHRDQRRVDLHWANTANPPRWSSFPEKVDQNIHRMLRTRSRRELQPIFVGTSGIEVLPRVDEIAVQAHGQLFILPGSELASYLHSEIDAAKAEQTRARYLALSFVFLVVAYCCEYAGRLPEAEGLVKRELRRVESESPFMGELEQSLDLQRLIQIIASTEWKTFNPSAWRRSAPV